MNLTFFLLIFYFSNFLKANLLPSKYLLPPMNQKKCGGCWAFAISSFVGDRYSILTNGKFDRWLSPQHMISCFKTNDIHGCGGVKDILEVLHFAELNGLFLYKDYPFYVYQRETIKSTQRCFEKFLYPNYQRFLVSNPKKLNVTNFDYIKKEIESKGSVILEMLIYEDFKNLSQRTFFDEGGVYEYNHINNKFIGGHAVTIVGWLNYKGRLVWIIKNSWGVEWGMSGYFYCYADGWNQYIYNKMFTADVPLLSNIDYTNIKLKHIRQINAELKMKDLLKPRDLNTTVYHNKEIIHDF